ncbi:hypothetical protein HZA76_00690 [Candidatus Roizmanbacteria bacterium]|nr:hypothetical protein [Candidatus Roizmanbacteria bacterium]
MKPLVEENVTVDAVLPETHLPVKLTVQVVAGHTKPPLTREQKVVRWIIVVVAGLVLVTCALTAAAALFLANYQVTF